MPAALIVLDTKSTRHSRNALLGALIHAHAFMPLPQTRFAAEPPGRIVGRTRQFIREMIGSGRMYGIWREQELAAQRMSQYTRQGES